MKINITHRINIYLIILASIKLKKRNKIRSIKKKFSLAVFEIQRSRVMYSFVRNNLIPVPSEIFAVKWNDAVFNGF